MVRILNSRTTTSQEKLLRGGLVFKAYRLVYHSTLGWRVTKKKKEEALGIADYRNASGPNAEMQWDSLFVAYRLYIVYRQVF